GWMAGRWQYPLRIGRNLLVFCLMAFAFLFFRGESLTQTLSVMRKLFSGWTHLANPAFLANECARAQVPLSFFAVAILCIVVVQAVQVLRSGSPLRARIAGLPAWGRWSIYYAGAAAVLLLGNDGGQFIYFQF